MKEVLLLLLFTAVALLSHVDGGPISTPKDGYKKKVVCYYGSWAVYRPGMGKFDVEDIDPYICTHLIYGFAGLQSYSNQIESLDPYNDLYDNWGKGAFERFTGLKKINPLLTTILAIGGWNEGSQKYSKMAASAESRKTFVQSCVDFVLKYGFDGLDLDWEYPAQRGGKPEDKANFVQLLRELRAAFDSHGLLLTSAVSAGKERIDLAYDVPGIMESVDWINLMTYDFHGTWEDYTGHYSPLYARPEEINDTAYLNTNFSVYYWEEMGASKEKIVMGMGLYGHGFTLNDPNQHGLYAPAYQAIPAGPYTGEAGTWGFNEICETMSREPWTVVRDTYYRAPYAYKSREWIGYDDLDSFKEKAQYILDHDLAGGMVWSIETDDFHGNCFSQKNPLLTELHNTLNGEIIRPTYPPTTTPSLPPGMSTSRESPTVAPAPTPIANDVCKHEGLNADPDDCTIFYDCTPDGKGGWDVDVEKCAEGTVFDPRIDACSWPQDVPGCGGQEEYIKMKKQRA